MSREQVSFRSAGDPRRYSTVGRPHRRLRAPAVAGAGPAATAATNSNGWATRGPQRAARQFRLAEKQMSRDATSSSERIEMTQLLVVASTRVDRMHDWCPGERRSLGRSQNMVSD